MTTISAENVAKLRARTGAGILDAKSALEEAKGNEEMAIEILRKKGKAQAVKKGDRVQTQGAIFVASTPSKAALVLVKCETDFVARSDRFLAFGQDLADHLLAKGPESFAAYSAEKVPAAVLELGENISVGETTISEAPVIGTYVHSNRKIGVVVGLDGGTQAHAQDVAMHGAAMSPQHVRPTDVPADVVAKEKEIWKDQMKDDKKPAEIKDKIMAGKEKKFREENALLTQPFVKDQSKTVEQMLGKAVVKEYLRVAIG